MKSRIVQRKLLFRSLKNIKNLNYRKWKNYWKIKIKKIFLKKPNLKLWNRKRLKNRDYRNKKKIRLLRGKQRLRNEQQKPWKKLERQPQKSKWLKKKRESGEKRIEQEEDLNYSQRNDYEKLKSLKF